MAEYISRGIDKSDYKLTLDSIARVGPGGNFLTDPLTVDLQSNESFTSRYPVQKFARRFLTQRALPRMGSWESRTGSRPRPTGF